MEAKIAYMQYSVVFGVKVIHLFRPSFPQFLSFQSVYLTIDLDKSSNIFLKIGSLKVWVWVWVATYVAPSSQYAKKPAFGKRN